MYLPTEQYKSRIFRYIKHICKIHSLIALEQLTQHTCYLVKSNHTCFLKMINKMRALKAEFEPLSTNAFSLLAREDGQPKQNFCHDLLIENKD